MRCALVIGVLAAAMQIAPLLGQAPENQSPAGTVAPDQRLRAETAAESEGSTVDAVLDKSVDAKKNKPGDQVSATTTADLKSGSGMMIPKGSKLIGHVTEAKAKAKGESKSELGISFDKAIPKGGSEIPIHASIQGLSKPQPAMMESAGMPAGPGVQPGLGGPGAPTTGPAAPGASPGPGGRSTAGVAKTETPPTENPDATRQASEGAVTPVPGLSVEPQSDSGGGTLITSTTRNVHLDSGTHIALKLAAEKQ